jgi:hypothetical protein
MTKPPRPERTTLGCGILALVILALALIAWLQVQP